MVELDLNLDLEILELRFIYNTLGWSRVFLFGFIFFLSFVLGRDRNSDCILFIGMGLGWKEEMYVTFGFEKFERINFFIFIRVLI